MRPEKCDYRFFLESLPPSLPLLGRPENPVCVCVCVCMHKALKFGLLDGSVMQRVLCISVGFKAQIALVVGAVVRSLFDCLFIDALL